MTTPHTYMIHFAEYIQGGNLDEFKTVELNGVGAIYRTKCGAVVTIVKHCETGWFIADNGKLYDSFRFCRPDVNYDIVEFIGFNDEIRNANKDVNNQSEATG
jgi:hypothetical protein